MEQLQLGDCLDVLPAMPAGSVDAIVTDPPYGLEFMSQEWDRLGAKFRELSPRDLEAGGLRERLRRRLPEKYAAPAAMQAWHETWAGAALRVAKPGAYLIAFGGTRTFHRLAVALEDAGWTIRDCLVWAYASGFPKSKATLKPAWEPILLARKPGPLRDLGIDACRIPFQSGEDRALAASAISFGYSMEAGTVADTVSFPNSYGLAKKQAYVDGLADSAGRWPANVLLTDPIFDGDVDGVVGGGEAGGGFGRQGTAGAVYESGTRGPGKFEHGSSGEIIGYGDAGTYSRFFLIPKAGLTEREPNYLGRQASGLEAQQRPAGDFHQWDGRTAAPRPNNPRINTHPTVKPLELMRHLIRLVTPTGGSVLDPFLGSGTTAIAAEMEGFAWIGIEREAAYLAIAEARLIGVQRGLGLAG